MRPKSPTLTAHELELMKIVWRHDDPVTVRDVYEELRQQRSVAANTTSRADITQGLSTLDRIAGPIDEKSSGLLFN